MKKCSLFGVVDLVKFEGLAGRRLSVGQQKVQHSVFVQISHSPASSVSFGLQGVADGELRDLRVPIHALRLHPEHLVGLALA